MAASLSRYLLVMRFWVPVLAILLLATTLRLHLLGNQSLWNDEGNAYVQATRSFSEIADHASRDIHPPGYYWLLAAWLRFTGQTEFTLRALSALVSVMSVAFAAALGLRLWGRTVGIIAALFVALNTFSIYYAQEARMYALLALWGIASMWALAGLLLRSENERWRWVIALGLFNAAGLYTQYAFPFVMLAQGLIIFAWLISDVRQRVTLPLRLVGHITASYLLALVLFLPWLSTAWRQVTTWPTTGQPLPVSEALPELLAYFAYGITVGEGTTITVLFFLLFGLLNLPDARHPRAWWRTLLPVLWVGTTISLFLALDLYREANLKFMLPAQIAFALWLARGVDVVWNLEPRRKAAWARWVPRSAAILGVLWLLSGMWQGVNPLYYDTAFHRDNYRGIAALIETEGGAGDAIILSAPNQNEVFSYYYDGDLPVYMLPRGLGGDDAATLEETRAVIGDYARVFAVIWGTDERDPNNVVEGTLRREAFEVSNTWYGDVRLVRYVTPADLEVFRSLGAEFGPTPGGAMFTLEQYALNTDVISAGDVLQVQLEWSVSAVPEQRYKVFVQLLNSDGILVAQRDSEPGDIPTTMWNPGSVIDDLHGLIIPDDLLPAHYALIVGLYDFYDPLVRMPVNDSDHYFLTSIAVR